MIARLITIALAIELFCAIVIVDRFANPTIFVGLFMVAIIIAFETMSFMDTRIRRATTAAGILVVWQAFCVHHFYPWTRWHDAIVGLAIVILSLFPNREVASDPPIMDEKHGGGADKMSTSV